MAQLSLAFTTPPAISKNIGPIDIADYLRTRMETAAESAWTWQPRLFCIRTYRC
jgi:hypothetical protein